MPPTTPREPAPTPSDPTAGHSPLPWKVGGRYGLIGVEIVDPSGHIALVRCNHAQDRRLASHESRATSAKVAQAGQSVMDRLEAERDALAASLPRASADASLIVAAVNHHQALADTVKDLCDLWTRWPNVSAQEMQAHVKAARDVLASLGTEVG